MKYYLYIVALLFFISSLSFSQDSIKRKTTASPLNIQAKKLEESLSKSDLNAAAKNYEELGLELMQKKEYAKAENYFKNALEIYTNQNKKKKISDVNRLIAQVQEQQNKHNEAVDSYEKARFSSPESNSAKINMNDANRVRNRGNIQTQIEILDSNIEILEEQGNIKEQVHSYKQRAESNLMINNKDKAIEDYSKAIEKAKDNPIEVVKLQNQVAKVYESENRMDEAIRISEQALEKAKASDNIDEELGQKLNLANLYNKNQLDQKAIELLEETYQTALNNGKTLEARKVVLALSEIYINQKNSEKSLHIYNRFLQDFERFIQADSSLVNAKIFASTEEKIQQLEKQQKLKDQLLLKTNRLNYVLIGSVLLMIILLGLIIKSLSNIKTKNKKIALQSLRREMNPHFIFNSLNSVNQFIAQNNELEANKYLSSYSNLMRNMMETSNKDFILLNNELEQIKKYLDLEHLRFPDKFNFEIEIDSTIDKDSVWIPNMLIQPNIENAIWHGLRYKESKGLLKINFIDEKKNIKVIIQDDGIGIKKSKELKTKNQKVHDSRGLNNVKERIKLLNNLYKQKITFEIKDRTDTDGTIVIFCFQKFPQV